MAGVEFTISLALCAPALLVNILLLIDSHSTIINNVIEVKKIRALFLAGVVQAISYFVEYVLYCCSFFEVRSLGMAVESLLYISNLLYIFTFADLIFSKYCRQYKRKIGRLLFLSPVFLLLVLETANAFLPVFFDIDPVTFEYSETPWVIVANVIPMLYILFSAVNDIAEWRKSSRYYNLPFSLYFLVIVVGIGLESIWFDIPIIPISCSISMAIMYIRILKRIGYIDTLSGLFARSHISVYVNSLLGKLPPLDDGGGYHARRGQVQAHQRQIRSHHRRQGYTSRRRYPEGCNKEKRYVL